MKNEEMNVRQLGANAYMKKHVSRDDFVEMVGAFSGLKKSTVKNKLVNIAIDMVMDEAGRLAICSGDGFKDMEITKEHFHEAINQYFESSD